MDVPRTDKNSWMKGRGILRQTTNDKQSPKHKLSNWTNRWSKAQADARCRNFPFCKQVVPFSQHLENLLTLNKFFPTKLKKKENM